MFTEWTQGVDEVAKTNLDKPLIVRDANSLQISVNFDPKVCPHKILLNENYGINFEIVVKTFCSPVVVFEVYKVCRNIWDQICLT